MSKITRGRMLYKACPFPFSKLRAYPSGLGASLEKVYREELERPLRGDLRFNRTPKDRSLSQRDLFMAMPTGDTWPDADLLDVFEYLYTSKSTRTARQNNSN